MKSSSEEKARLRTLISDAISHLCKNSLGLIDLQFSIEALIGISVNNEDVMVLSFKETVLPDGAAVSYVWQKESGENKDLETVDNDANVGSNALFGATTAKNVQHFRSEHDCSEENYDAADLSLKADGEMARYEEYNNNLASTDGYTYDVNSSSPQITNPYSSISVNKRRKQSVPIRVYNEQSDYDDAVIKLEPKGQFDGHLVDDDYGDPSSFAALTKGSNEHVSITNGESRFLHEKSRHLVPSKQSAHKTLNLSKAGRKSISKGDYVNFTGYSGKVFISDYASDLSPNCSLTATEQDSYLSQAENYTYQMLNSSHLGGIGAKRKKQVASSSSKNFSEQDSLIISEMQPFLYDQHRPMLIPPTVTQFAPKKRCRVCYSKKIRKEVRYCCFGCSDHPGLCLDPCFYQFHLVRGCAHPRPADSINYLEEVPAECLQNVEDCGSYPDTGSEMT